MSKSSDIAGHVQAPPQSRTILLALRFDIEPRKIGIYDIARRQGWNVLDLRYYNWLAPQTARPDGVLFQLDPTREDEPIAMRLLELGVPVVQIEEYVLPEKFCCVIPDRRAVGQAAAEHFADRGFRNMAYLHSLDPDDATGRSFVEHARRLGAKAGMIAVHRPGRVTQWNRVGELAGQFAEEIAAFELPLGVFTYHDAMAIRICQFCGFLGLSVPEQVAVLGCGNDAYKCEFAATPLSSLDPNYYGQGRAAAEMLDRLMDGEPAPAEPVVVSPAGVVTRKSTDVLALPDVETARALRYMWEHLSEPLGVDRIAAAVAVSRRKLERHFRQHLGRSVNDELIRKRVERCCELLVATKTSVRAIARQVGFLSEKHYFKVFREAMGMTPKRYRQAHAAQAGMGQN